MKHPSKYALDKAEEIAAIYTAKVGGNSNLHELSLRTSIFQAIDTERERATCLLEALEFYGVLGNHAFEITTQHLTHSNVFIDAGERARLALEKWKGMG